MCKDCFLSNAILEKSLVNDEKPRYSYCIVIEPHNIKVMLYHLHGYHTPEHKNIAIPAMAFSPYNFKILPISHMEFFWVSNPT